MRYLINRLYAVIPSLPEPVISLYASKNRTLSAGSRIKLEKPIINTKQDIVITA